MAGFAFLAFVVSACASTQAYREELGRYQALADQATDHFHKTRVSVMLTHGNDISRYLPLNRILLNTRAGFEKSLPLLAHELGHYLLGHVMMGGAGSANEMEANAVGVEVLRVWGQSEQQSVVTMAGLLCRRMFSGRSLPGHLSAAEELEHLRRRFNRPDVSCTSLGEGISLKRPAVGGVGADDAPRR